MPKYRHKESRTTPTTLRNVLRTIIVIVIIIAVAIMVNKIVARQVLINQSQHSYIHHDAATSAQR